MCSIFTIMQNKTTEKLTKNIAVDRGKGYTKIKKKKFCLDSKWISRIFISFYYGFLVPSVNFPGFYKFPTVNIYHFYNRWGKAQLQINMDFPVYPQLKYRFLVKLGKYKHFFKRQFQSRQPERPFPCVCRDLTWVLPSGVLLLREGSCNECFHLFILKMTFWPESELPRWLRFAKPR